MYFDGPGGTQVPQLVIDAVSKYYTKYNSNTGGAFATSEHTDAVIASARAAIADFFNAPSPEQIIFGANMTSLTFHLSRSIARELQPGDEIILTRLDHDANISPWLALQERGAVIRFVDVKLDDMTLDYEHFEQLLSSKTRLVAVGYASNAVGTINDVARIVRLAHQVGAWVYVDAVHYAPHAPIDVQQLDCDFLVASAYKFFGPHLGVLYGKTEVLEPLTSYKVRPQDEQPPGKFETGTLNHEGLAGTTAAIDYLSEIGKLSESGSGELTSTYDGRRLLLKRAMTAIQQYEMACSAMLIVELQKLSGMKLYGISEQPRYAWRTPTVGFRMASHSPREITEKLASENIYTWDGHFYALEVIRGLGLEDQGGVVRVGLVHYNTEDEIERLIRVLDKLQTRKL